MSIVTRRSVLAGALLVASPAWAGLFDPTPEEEEAFLETLKTPGHALLLRHALAPGHGDPGDFSLSECARQRNLNGEGRAQAVHIGEWLRARNITPRTVYSSQWCRCLDTANLMGFEPVVPEPALNSFSDVSGTESEKLARLRRFMSTQVSQEGIPIMVTHTSNIVQLVGGLLGSGEGAVVKVQPEGSVTLVGRILFGLERV